MLPNFEFRLLVYAPMPQVVAAMFALEHLVEQLGLRRSPIANTFRGKANAFVRFLGVLARNALPA